MYKTKLNNNLRAAMLIAATGLTAAYSANSSAADVIARSRSTSKFLSDTGAPVAILAVTVPAGTWVVNAKVNPVNFGAADYVRCRIMVGTSQKDAGATLLGNAAPSEWSVVYAKLRDEEAVPEGQRLAELRGEKVLA